MVQIIRRNPLFPFHPFQSELDRVLGGLLPATGGELQERGPQVEVDLRETDEEVLVRAEVPGIQPDELEVQVHGDVLTIAGEKKDDRETEEGGWRVTERRFGSVRRQLRLPADVDASKVTAEAKNGVLTLHLPKTQAAQPRKIEVKSAD
jgi:HSP20 family protein